MAKTFYFILFVITCIFHSQSYAQDTLKVKSLEEAIDNSLSSFRKYHANKNAIIYNIVEVNLNTNEISFAKNEFIVENTMNAREIDYKTKKFVLKFIVSIENGRTFVKVIQFRLNKKSNKAIELTNLMSGCDYEIIK